MSQTLGTDRSGNNNNWTVNNITISDQMVDSPTNNFATLNPLGGLQTSTITFSEGNLKASNAAGGTEPIASSTIAMTSGKWYFEYRNLSGNGSVGIQDTNNAGQSYIYHDNQGGFGSGYYYNGSLRATDGQDANYGAAWGNTDIIGVALDVDNGTLVFYKNNASQGTAETGLPSSASLGYRFVISTDAATAMANFGQDSSFAGNSTAQGNTDGNDIGDFYYTPPTGFLALCTSNLPDVAVIPSEHFNAVIYSGNATARSITTSFQPDWIWIKQRSGTQANAIIDALRGTSKVLASHSTAAEYTDTNRVTSFNSDGLSIGTDSGVNASGETYVAWNWKANGSGASNTNGSINSTVSANVDAGFSIVSYTGNGSAGATVGHGLNSKPEMIIIKSRSGSAKSWYVYHEGLHASSPEDYRVELNTTNAASSNTTGNSLQGTAPTNSLFTLGNGSWVNENTKTLIAYCFHSVDGYSKVGSYTGNANADGTFVYTGFRPAYVLVKPTTVSNHHWWIHDTARNPINPSTKQLRTNVSNAEYDDATYTALDILSNGFKWRTSEAQVNAAANFIYIAFAETPFKYSNAR